MRELDGKHLLDRLRTEDKLPALSPAATELLRMRRSGETRIGAVKASVESDAKLEAIVLGLAAGHFDAPPSDEADESDGDTLLWFAADQGPGPVRLAALALGILACNPVGTCEGFDYDGFWSRALARAVAARELSIELEIGRPLELFAAALLAEIGTLMLAGAFPSEYSGLLQRPAAPTRDELTDRQREAFGADGTSLTIAMFEFLGFSEDLVAEIDDALIGDLHGMTTVRVGDGSAEVLEAAQATAELMLADSSTQVELWFELVQLRHRLRLDLETFYAVGDRVAAEWWAWGEHLHIPTVHVQSFGDLAQEIFDFHQGEGVEGHGLALLAPADDSQGGLGEVPLRVLVVEDDPIALRLLQTHMQKAGHEVTTARDGREGLARALEDLPNLIIADWVMPEMDGVDLCRALRRFEAGRRIFFMLVTGREESERIVEAFDAGVDDYLTKPVKPRALLARMRAAVRFLGLQRKLEEEKRRLREELNRKKQLTGKLRMAALTDMLTELPNRRYAIKRLKEEWASSDRNRKPLSLIMLDIDHFKSVNDTFGHDVGDEVLREMARILERHTRVGESACRLGGEEFVVICADSALDDALQCAERIRLAVEKHHIEAGSFSGSITVSLGVAERRPDTQDMDHLLKLADEAVYRAKALGRNRTVLASGGGAGLQEAG